MCERRSCNRRFADAARTKVSVRRHASKSCAHREPRMEATTSGPLLKLVLNWRQSHPRPPGKYATIGCRANAARLPEDTQAQDAPPKSVPACRPFAKGMKTPTSERGSLVAAGPYSCHGMVPTPPLQPKPTCVTSMPTNPWLFPSLGRPSRELVCTVAYHRPDTSPA